MVNNNLLSLKMSKCILSVKFSYVRFISQVWKYVYNTFNVLFTSHLHPISFCWATYWAPVELLCESFLSHVTWLCYFLHELWWADLIHPLNVLMHSSVREFWFSMWLDVLLFPSMNWGPWGWLNPSSECVVAFSVNTQVDWFLGKFFLWSSTLYCLYAQLLTSVSLQTCGFGSTRHSCNDWQDFPQLGTKCRIARKWVAKPLNDDVFKCIHPLHATNMVADHCFTILAPRVYGTLIFSPSLSRFSIPTTSLFCKFCSKGWWVVVNWVQNFSLFEYG